MGNNIDYRDSRFVDGYVPARLKLFSHSFVDMVVGLVGKATPNTERMILPALKSLVMFLRQSCRLLCSAPLRRKYFISLG